MEYDSPLGLKAGDTAIGAKGSGPAVFFMASFSRSGETMLLRELDRHPDVFVPYNLAAKETKRSLAALNVMRFEAEDHLSPEQAHALGIDCPVVVAKQIWEHPRPFNGFILVRNPLSVAASILRHLPIVNGSAENRAGALRRWAGYVEEGYSTLVNDVSDDDLFLTYTAAIWARRMRHLLLTGLPIIHYERFVKEPEKWLGKLATHLSLAPRDWQDNPFRDSVSGHGGNDLSRPVDQASLTSFSEILTARQIDSIRLVARDVALDYGYRLTGDQVEVDPQFDSRFSGAPVRIGEAATSEAYLLRRYRDTSSLQEQVNSLATRLLKLYRPLPGVDEHAGVDAHEIARTLEANFDEQDRQLANISSGLSEASDALKMETVQQAQALRAQIETLLAVLEDQRTKLDVLAESQNARLNQLDLIATGIASQADGLIQQDSDQFRITLERFNVLDSSLISQTANLGRLADRLTVLTSEGEARDRTTAALVSTIESMTLQHDRLLVHLDNRQLRWREQLKTAWQKLEASEQANKAMALEHTRQVQASAAEAAKNDALNRNRHKRALDARRHNEILCRRIGKHPAARSLKLAAFDIQSGAITGENSGSYRVHASTSDASLRIQMPKTTGGGWILSLTVGTPADSPTRYLPPLTIQSGSGSMEYTDQYIMYAGLNPIIFLVDASAGADSVELQIPARDVEYQLHNFRVIGLRRRAFGLLRTKRWLGRVIAGISPKAGANEDSPGT